MLVVERGEMLILLKLFSPSIENNVRRFKKKKNNLKNKTHNC